MLKQKQFGDCLLDGELVLFDGDEPLHRADTIAHVFKNKKGGDGLMLKVTSKIKRIKIKNIPNPYKNGINGDFY